MAVGKTRVYVRVAGELNLSSYSMDSYPFAHTGPIWIGRVGSLDPEAARASARDLLAWLDVADKRLEEGYEGSAIPTLEARFAGARRKLESLSR
jgi:TolB protein